MTALPDWDIASDADLAGAAAAGDRAAFAGIYDRYADRLHDFCIGMLRDREAAADCVQEAFCKAAVELTKLREPDKLRPWLYAIARNEALRCIRQRRREYVSDDLPEEQSFDAGPDTLAARTELASLIAEAAGGLPERDRLVLELSYRHGLDGPELAQALGVSQSNATKLVQRLRETIERSLGALLVARGVQRNPQACPELGVILSDWDGHFNVLLRKRVARHIDSCSICEANRRSLVSPRALLGVAPILMAAPRWLRGQTMNKVALTSAAFALDPNASSNAPSTAESNDNPNYPSSSDAPSSAESNNNPNYPGSSDSPGSSASTQYSTSQWANPQYQPITSAFVGPGPGDLDVTEMTQGHHWHWWHWLKHWFKDWYKFFAILAAIVAVAAAVIFIALNHLKIGVTPSNLTGTTTAASTSPAAPTTTPSAATTPPSAATTPPSAQETPPSGQTTPGSEPPVTSSNSPGPTVSPSQAPAPVHTPTAQTPILTPTATPPVHPTSQSIPPTQPTSQPPITVTERPHPTGPTPTKVTPNPVKPSSPVGPTHPR